MENDGKGSRCNTEERYDVKDVVRTIEERGERGKQRAREKEKEIDTESPKGIRFARH